MTQREEAQQALQPLAEIVEWWMECPGDSVVPPPSYGINHALAYCTRCDGTGKVLRYPPMFEAVFRRCSEATHTPGDQWCGGSGYIVRPVMEFLWRMLNGEGLTTDGLEVMKAWGFDYRTCITWGKTTAVGTPALGFGQ